MKRLRTKCIACGRVYRIRYVLRRSMPPERWWPWCRPCRKPTLAVAG